MSEVELVELEEQPVAIVRGQVSVAEIPSFLGEAFGEVMRVVASQGKQPAGPPFGRYEPTEDGFVVAAGFPISAAVVPDGRVEADTLPGGPAASVLYRGDYAGVAEAYQAAQQWLDQQGYRVAGAPWESYLDEPEVAQPRTLVRIPCAPAAPGAPTG